MVARRRGVARRLASASGWGPWVVLRLSRTGFPWGLVPGRLQALLVGGIVPPLHRAGGPGEGRGVRARPLLACGGVGLELLDRLPGTWAPRVGRGETPDTVPGRGHPRGGSRPRRATGIPVIRGLRRRRRRVRLDGPGGLLDDHQRGSGGWRCGRGGYPPPLGIERQRLPARVATFAAIGPGTPMVTPCVRAAGRVPWASSRGHSGRWGEQQGRRRHERPTTSWDHLALHSTVCTAHHRGRLDVIMVRRDLARKSGPYASQHTLPPTGLPRSRDGHLLYRAAVRHALGAPLRSSTGCSSRHDGHGVNITVSIHG